jgi:hypothetical protein
VNQNASLLFTLKVFSGGTAFMKLRLIYISTAGSSLSMNALKRLVQRAEQRNIERGLTGVLLYNGTEFLQCLEGDFKEVSAVYQRILVDPHHHDVHLLQAVPMSEHLFSGWGLRFFPVGPMASMQVEPTVYSYLDPRLSRPWGKMGFGLVDMVLEYAKVKKELEKVRPKPFSSYDQVEDAA